MRGPTAVQSWNVRWFFFFLRESELVAGKTVGGKQRRNQQEGNYAVVFGGSSAPSGAMQLRENKSCLSIHCQQTQLWSQYNEICVLLDGDVVAKTNQKETDSRTCENHGGKCMYVVHAIEIWITNTHTHGKLSLHSSLATKRYIKGG